MGNCMDKRFDKYNKYVMEGGCPTVAAEDVRVTVPVLVRACANIGDVELRCMGGAIITRNSHCMPGRPHAISRFTVCQKMHVDIPIEFLAECDIGEEYVDYDFDDSLGDLEDPEDSDDSELSGC